MTHTTITHATMTNVKPPCAHASPRDFGKVAGLVVAFFALFFAAMPVQQAEAKKGRNAALIGGLIAGGLIGGALIGSQRPAYANPGYGQQPVYHPQPVYRPQPVYTQPYQARPVYNRPAYGQQYVEVEQECFQVRERVWDRSRGRYVNVRRTICE